MVPGIIVQNKTFWIWVERELHIILANSTKSILKKVTNSKVERLIHTYFMIVMQTWVQPVGYDISNLSLERVAYCFSQLD